MHRVGNGDPLSYCQKCYVEKEQALSIVFVLYNRLYRCKYRGCLLQVYKIRGTEDIFVVLEDNRVVLSSMKSNRFHIHFASDINIWEKKLSLVSETIEMITQVT